MRQTKTIKPKKKYNFECCKTCRRPFTEEEIAEKKRLKSVRITQARTVYDPRQILELSKKHDVETVAKIMGCGVETVYRVLLNEKKNLDIPVDGEKMRIAREALDERMARAAEKRVG